MVPLTTALSKLLNCKAENLAEYLNNPEAVNKASVYLSGKTLKTTYLNRDGTTKQVKFGNFSLKSASDTYAFEGFLEVKVHQYFYIKYRIRLLYPQLKCVVEYHNKGHSKYYPLELLAIDESGEESEKSTEDHITVFSTRLKNGGENFVPFDDIVDFGDNAKFRIRSRNKVFTLPLRHPEVWQAEPVAGTSQVGAVQSPPPEEMKDEDERKGTT